MKENKGTTFIIIGGMIVLGLFVLVAVINLLPNYESNSYYVRVGDTMSAKIESVNIKNGTLILHTSGDPIEYCVKATRTSPSVNAVCWNKVENNSASISVFKNRKYYIWIKDEQGNISDFLSVNANDNK